MRDTKVKLNYCPECNGELSGATHVSGNKSPDPGDITVCGYCATVLKFQEDMTLERMGLKEIFRLSSDVKKELLMARELVLKYKKDGNKS